MPYGPPVIGSPARTIPAGVILGLLSAIASAALPPQGAAAQANPQAVPAVYATKAEAEAAARKHFNCSGAHPMGQQWMPCAKHGQASGAGHHHH